jgi:hypothetical protein
VDLLHHLIQVPLELLLQVGDLEEQIGLEVQEVLEDQVEVEVEAVFFMQEEQEILRQQVHHKEIQEEMVQRHRFLEVVVEVEQELLEQLELDHLLDQEEQV